MSEENLNPGGPAGQPQSPEDALNAIKASIANAFNLRLYFSIMIIIGGPLYR